VNIHPAPVRDYGKKTPGGSRDTHGTHHDGKKTPGGAGTHTGHIYGKKTPGEPGHTRDTRDTRAHARAHGSHRRISQPSKPNDTPARPRDGRNRGRLNSRSAARRAAGPEPTAPRGRLRRGRPQRTRPCLHPLPERLPTPARRQ
jgi:hypothetical protein